MDVRPALHVLWWRYREQLSWRPVMIGLRDEVGESAAAAFDPQASLLARRAFSDLYGISFALVPKPRLAGTGRGCLRDCCAAGDGPDPTPDRSGSAPERASCAATSRSANTLGE